MERWNTYTRDGVMTDKIAVRGEPLPDGLYHLACEVLIRHTDGTYLLMKRSLKKSDYQGFYEASAGGAAKIGEDKLACIKREMREETGLSSDSFIEIAHNVDDENRVIVDSFFTTVDCDKSSVTLQEGETDAYLWVSEEDFIKYVNSGKMIDRQRARLDSYFRKIGYVK